MPMSASPEQRVFAGLMRTGDRAGCFGDVAPAAVMMRLRRREGVLPGWDCPRGSCRRDAVGRAAGGFLRCGCAAGHRRGERRCRTGSVGLDVQHGRRCCEDRYARGRRPSFLDWWRVGGRSVIVDLDDAPDGVIGPVVSSLGACSAGPARQGSSDPPARRAVRRPVSPGAGALSAGSAGEGWQTVEARLASTPRGRDRSE